MENKFVEMSNKIAEATNSVIIPYNSNKKNRGEQEQHLQIVGIPKRVSEITDTNEVPTIIEEININTTDIAVANSTGLTMQPLMIMLDDDGDVISDQIVDNDQSLMIDNSAIITVYPILSTLESVVREKNLDIMFLDTQNMPGYIMGQVLENEVLNSQLSFTVDLKGNFMSPDEKIFVSNEYTDFPVALKISNIDLLKEIISGEHIDTDLSIFDIYTKEDREIGKLVNLATLPELVDSTNRNKVITLLLRSGFQTVFSNARKVDDQAYFIFDDYKTPNSFKLVSINSNKPISISTINGKATLTHE